MARYKITARNSAGALGLEEPLTAAEAYYKLVELRDSGYDHIVLTNIDTGEQIVDVDQLLRDSRDA